MMFQIERLNNKISKKTQWKDHKLNPSQIHRNILHRKNFVENNMSFLFWFTNYYNHFFAHNEVNITCCVILKWVQTTMKEKKICACSKKFKLMTKNVQSNITMYMIKKQFNFRKISLMLWSTFILVLYSNHIFTASLSNS